MSAELNNISESEAMQSTAILQAVGLGDRLDYYPENLSGGQSNV